MRQKNKNNTVENAFKALSDLIADPLVIIDSGTIVQAANKAVKQVTGYDEKYLVGKSFLQVEFLDEENKTILKKNFEKRMKGIDVEPYEVKLTAKNGQTKYIELRGKRIEYFGKQVNLVVLHDVTQRKKVQTQLETTLSESESKLRSVFESSPDPIAVSDINGNIIDCNPAALKTFGYSMKNEVVGRNVYEFFSEKDRQNAIENLKAAGNGSVKNAEYTFKGKDEREFPADLSSSPLFNTKGKIVGFVSTIKDLTERKEEEKKLRDSEERFRQVAENADEWIWEVDFNGLYTYASPVVEKVLGYKPEEIVGKKHFYDLFHHEDREQLKKVAFEAFAQKLSFSSLINRNIHKNGKDVWLSTSGIPLIDQLGNLRGYRGTDTDITERKKAEEALRESEERSKAIVANAPIGIAVTGADKRILSANDAFCKILGYTEDELRKLTFKDITHPEDLEESVAKIKELEAGRVSYFKLEKRYVKKDGEVIYGKIMVSTIRNQGGNPSLFIAELEDITGAKKRELELKEERKKLEAITQSIGAGFVVISKDYHVLWANKFIKEYKGNVEGKVCYSSLNDLDHICPGCGVKKIFEKGVNFDAHEYSSIDIRGNPYCVQIIATPIKDEAENIVSAVEVAVDVTEKKNLQSKLAEYSQKLERLVDERTKQLEETQIRLVKTERLAAIGELAGMIGHDLRNPLTGIKNATYLLKKKGSKLPETEIKAMLEIIEKGIDHSDKIINDLLDYAREMQLELQIHPLQWLLTEALTMIKVPENVKIINKIPDTLSIKIDQDKIERVFINLVKNAMDAMPNGGTITLNCEQKNGNVEISFVDTGSGIPEELLPKIFSPLFTTKAKGMGFGLAICKRIIEAHRGKITVESNSGKGTTFTITLPVEPKLEVGGEKTWINLPESLLSTTTKT
jgi:PAS domain S-box-containing protein